MTLRSAQMWPSSNRIVSRSIRVGSGWASLVDFAMDGSAAVSSAVVAGTDLGCWTGAEGWRLAEPERAATREFFGLADILPRWSVEVVDMMDSGCSSVAGTDFRGAGLLRAVFLVLVVEEAREGGTAAEVVVSESVPVAKLMLVN